MLVSWVPILLLMTLNFVSSGVGAGLLLFWPMLVPWFTIAGMLTVLSIAVYDIVANSKF